MTQSVLVSSCARAATAEEAAFRIDYPLAAARNTRVVALDDTAEQKDPQVGPWAARYLQECLPVHEYGDVPVAEQTADTASTRILEFLRGDG
ncbi:hypothetical protein ABZ904_44580 [Streptomyces sp. NPDC046900]|uniref:hypothetical protein n=1 Tax=Streptomyces sp. NPDC046900 TaxID=3155473 RepID=UPI003409AC0B